MYMAYVYHKGNVKYIIFRIFTWVQTGARIAYYGVNPVVWAKLKYEAPSKIAGWGDQCCAAQWPDPRHRGETPDGLSGIHGFCRCQASSRFSNSSIFRVVSPSCSIIIANDRRKLLDVVDTFGDHDPEFAHQTRSNALEEHWRAHGSNGVR
jgi:hypothetical protein